MNWTVSRQQPFYYVVCCIATIDNLPRPFLMPTLPFKLHRKQHMVIWNAFLSICKWDRKMQHWKNSILSFMDLLRQRRTFCACAYNFFRYLLRAKLLAGRKEFTKALADAQTAFQKKAELEAQDMLNVYLVLGFSHLMQQQVDAAEKCYRVQI